MPQVETTPSRRRSHERTILAIELNNVLTSIDLLMADWQSDARVMLAKARHRSLSPTERERLVNEAASLVAQLDRARDELELRSGSLSPRARSDTRVVDRFRALELVGATVKQAQDALGHVHQ